MLALLALVPAVLGVGVSVALTQNHAGDSTAVVEFSVALWAFAVAFSLGLLWLVVGAINWQIKEAVRGRG